MKINIEKNLGECGQRSKLKPMFVPHPPSHNYKK